MSSSYSSFISSFTDGFFVDCNPFRYLCICPIVVWIDFGRCFLTAFAVTPENVVNRKLFIEFIEVFTHCQIP